MCKDACRSSLQGSKNELSQQVVYARVIGISPVRPPAQIVSDVQALDSLEALRLLLKQSVKRGKPCTLHLR
jgi:hypothetical protein